MIGELVAILSLSIVVLLYLDSRRRMNQVQNMIPSLDDIVRVNEDGTIDMDSRLQAIITGVGQTMMQSFKMSALQGLSVDSKIQKGLEGNIALDVVEETMPILHMAGDFLGVNTKAYIKKNPKALFQLVGMINQASGGKLAGVLAGNFMRNNGQQTAQSGGNVPLMR